jgi:hypothetical protein
MSIRDFAAARLLNQKPAAHAAGVADEAIES